MDSRVIHLLATFPTMLSSHGEAFYAMNLRQNRDYLEGTSMHIGHRKLVDDRLCHYEVVAHLTSPPVVAQIQHLELGNRYSASFDNLPDSAVETPSMPSQAVIRHMRASGFRKEHTVVARQ